MKIVPIFAEEIDGIPRGLYSVSLDGNPENNTFYSFIEWMEDTEKMTDFFTETHRQSALSFDFYSPTTISDAIERTRREADAFQELLENHFNQGIDELTAFLEEIFKPLDNNAAFEQQLQPSKTRGRTKHLSKKQQYWIRIYAIKIESGMYIMTGGIVKLFLKMDDDDAVIEQKTRLLQVRDFLKEAGIIDAESTHELIIEL